MMRFVITGTPGAGKTALIRQLELDGFGVVEEAVTDVIAAGVARGVEPWKDPAFIDTVAGLQKTRQLRAACQSDAIQFHDRSVVCTVALARYLGYPVSPVLARELGRVQADAIFRKEVFFIRSLGFVTPTAARRITFEESLRFERLHEETYRECGFELISIEPGGLVERASAVKAVAATLAGRPTA